MMIFKKSMPRRTFLRGAGAAIAVPFLDAMVPALAASSASSQLRVGFIYLPVGRIMENWTPTAVGSDYELTPTLEPLAGFLTGAHPFPDRVGISFDQLAARHLGQDTPLASMELGIDPPEWAGQGAGDYSGFYTSTVSWRTPTTPLPIQNNPRTVFERLFGDTDTLDPETMRRRIERKGSVLDAVTARVNAMKTSVRPFAISSAASRRRSREPPPITTRRRART
jgi:hypothetical protein